MSYVAYAVIALGGVAAVAAIAVFFIPSTFSTTMEMTFDARIEEVWEVYTEPEKQPDWRSDVGAVSVAEDGKSWTETLNRGGMVIHFSIVKETPPRRLVLKTGSVNNFEGRYIADFREVEGQTIGTFTEEATTLGIIPRLIRFAFFDQAAFIRKYAEEARAEIIRRRPDQSG